MDILSIILTIVAAIIAGYISYRQGKNSQIDINNTFKSELNSLRTHISVQIGNLETVLIDGKSEHQVDYYRKQIEEHKKHLEEYRQELSKALRTWLPDDAHFSGEKCPQCGAPTYFSDVGGMAYPGMVVDQCTNCDWTSYK